ncbi:hypothetical protein SCALM49S_01580 [Streptomyces californicus]
MDPTDPLGTPDEALTLYGTPHWAKIAEKDKGELRKHYTSWQFSQFLHGEQGAMVCAARIVESVPDLDAELLGHADLDLVPIRSASKTQLRRRVVP